MKKVFVLLVLFLAALAVAVGLSFRETQKSAHPVRTENVPISEAVSSASSPQSASGTETGADTVPASSLLLEIKSPTSGTVSTPSVDVTGKTAPYAFVIINEFEMKADGAGAFSKTVALDEGENYISVIAYTEEGEVAETELMVVRE